MPLDSSHQGEAEARRTIGDRCEGKQTVRLLEEPQIQMKVFPKLQLELATQNTAIPGGWRRSFQPKVAQRLFGIDL